MLDRRFAGGMELVVGECAARPVQADADGCGSVDAASCTTSRIRIDGVYVGACAAVRMRDMIRFSSARSCGGSQCAWLNASRPLKISGVVLP